MKYVATKPDGSQEVVSFNPVETPYENDAYKRLGWKWRPVVSPTSKDFDPYNHVGKYFYQTQNSMRDIFDFQKAIGEDSLRKLRACVGMPNAN